MTNLKNLTKWKKKLDKIYKSQKSNNFASSYFYGALSSNYSYTIRIREKDKKFFAFYPKGCKMEQLILKFYHDYCYELEEKIKFGIKDMLMYGIAYLYLEVKYENDSNSDNKTVDEIKNFDIKCMRGIPKKCVDYIKFYYLSPSDFDEKIYEKNMKPSELVIFDLKELGYKRNYFRKIGNKLDKYSLLENSHKNCIKSLKLTKDIGWIFYDIDLRNYLDSYRSYREIQKNKLKAKFLDYALKKLNDKIAEKIGDSDFGKIITNKRISDYDQLWDSFLKCEITSDELTNILFPKE